MVGASLTHHRKFTGGCNNICQRTWNQPCADYTREAVLRTTSLAEIEIERPRTLYGIELVAINNLLCLFLRHGIGLGCNLHRLYAIGICAIECNSKTALGEGLLDLGHVNRTIIFRARLASDRVDG